MKEKQEKKFLGMSPKEISILTILCFLILLLLIFLIFLYSGNINVNNFVSFFQQTSTQYPTKLVFLTSTKQLPTATKIILPEIVITPSATIEPTATLQYPLTYIYEGGTIDCDCYKCICITKQDFRVRLTIEQDGVVSGIFEQYLIDYPDMDIVGDKSIIYGTVNNSKISNDLIEFNGKLSDDLNKLEVTIYFRGENYYGRRIILLYKK